MGEPGPSQPEAAPGFDDFGYIMLAFIIFTVALAIVRSIYTHTVGKLPKNNWKSQFKRRLVGANRNNQLPENAGNGQEPETSQNERQSSVIERGARYLASRGKREPTPEKKGRFDPELENYKNNQPG